MVSQVPQPQTRGIPKPDEFTTGLWDIAVYGGTMYQRFRVAWAMRAKQNPASEVMSSCASLAKALQIHPSSLSPSNLRLSQETVRKAAEIFGVDPAFLNNGFGAPVPGWLTQPLATTAAVRHMLEERAQFHGGVERWYPSMLLERCSAEALLVPPEGAGQTLIRLIGEVRRDPCFHQCHAALRRALLRQLREPIGVNASLRDWLSAIESILAVKSWQAVDDPQLQVARTILEAIQRASGTL